MNNSCTIIKIDPRRWQEYKALRLYITPNARSQGVT